MRGVVHLAPLHTRKKKDGGQKGNMRWEIENTTSIPWVSYINVEVE